MHSLSSVSLQSSSVFSQMQGPEEVQTLFIFSLWCYQAKAKVNGRSGWKLPRSSDPYLRRYFTTSQDPHLHINNLSGILSAWVNLYNYFHRAATTRILRSLSPSILTRM